MARPFKYTQDELDRAKELRDCHLNEREARAAASFILMAESGMTLKALASAYGVTSKTIHEDIKRIRSPDTEEQGIWGGGNNHLMTFEEEEQFLDGYLDEALAGHIITMPKLHNEYNLRVGKQTPKSTFYRMLKRHNWRKVLPDTRHPKVDPQIKEDFKKKHSKWKWKKL